MKKKMLSNVLVSSLVGMLIFLSISTPLSLGNSINTIETLDRDVTKKINLFEETQEYKNIFESYIRNKEQGFDRGNKFWNKLIEKFYVKAGSGKITPSNTMSILSIDSVICGYVNDSETNESIEGADVTIYWPENQGKIGRISNFTDSSGFYCIDAEPKEVVFLVVRASGYFTESVPIENIGEGETLWVNVSLNPGAPVENSVVCGYINDTITGDPIEDADLFLAWADDQEHFDLNYTSTDCLGYYSINVASGDISLFTYKDGYLGEYPYYSDILPVMNDGASYEARLVVVGSESNEVCSSR